VLRRRRRAKGFNKGLKERLWPRFDIVDPVPIWLKSLSHYRNRKNIHSQGTAAAFDMLKRRGPLVMDQNTCRR
jgi:hypothetical protein